VPSSAVEEFDQIRDFSVFIDNAGFDLMPEYFPPTEQGDEILQESSTQPNHEDYHEENTASYFPIAPSPNLKKKSKLSEEEHEYPRK
jgi:hypothetical protein